VGAHAQPHVVEVDPTGLVWVKSSASGGDSSNCIEIARQPKFVLVRDSKYRTGAHLTFTCTTWQTLLRQL
jgi:Domain of unknown function (DUF397)